MSIENSPHGNHMMVGIDKDPPENPDDYRVCSGCDQQAHIEDVVSFKGKDICRWCWKKQEHEYTCNKHRGEFKAMGIPTECPKCGSWFIEHETSRASSWINDEQESRNISERVHISVTRIAL